MKFMLEFDFQPDLQSLCGITKWLEYMDEAEISYPGGQGRKTIAVCCGNDKFILSKRRSVGRAQLEAEVLKRLQKTGAVPALVRHDGEYVVQKHVTGPRLSEVFDSCRPDQRQLWLERAIESLLTLQRNGHAAGLSEIVPQIGARAGWEEDLVDVPARLADHLGISPPEFDRRAVLELLRPTKRVFIKWDARPGNAIVRQDGTVCWIDWEHCGARAAGDDLAWLLADEWSPSHQSADAYLSDILPEQELASWRAMAILHSCVRLSLITSRKPENGWWNHASALKHDRVGVTSFHVKRLCSRAGKWAEQAPSMMVLATFFQAVEGNLTNR